MFVSLAPLILAAVTLLPLKPVQTINLSAQGLGASDVAWLNDDEVLVALLKGGVAKVSIRTRNVSTWLPNGELPNAVPHAELIDADDELVVVMAGNWRSFSFRKTEGSPIHGYEGGTLFPRGVAVSGGKAYYLGWLTQKETDADQQSGALWTQVAGQPLSERPLHRVMSAPDALARWRKTMHPYGGSVVALADGSVAVVTSAEPGIFRYDRNGRLLEVLGSGLDELVLDSADMIKKGYGRDVVARYRDFLDRQPTIDDLVATPAGVRILARTAAKNTITWQLWKPGRTNVEGVQPLDVKANGPIGHMKCDARGKRLACVTNLPTAEQAAQPGAAASNPTLFLFQLDQ